MHKVLLVRESTGPEGTFGRMEIQRNDGTRLELQVLELPWKENRRNVSCIPAGNYRIGLYPSSRFGQRYLVRDVSGRSGILFHPGNWGGDVELGYKSDIEGCILPGLKRGVLDGQMAVLSSRAACQQFEEFLEGKDASLEIQWENVLISELESEIVLPILEDAPLNEDERKELERLRRVEIAARALLNRLGTMEELRRELDV